MTMCHALDVAPDVEDMVVDVEPIIALPSMM